MRKILLSMLCLLGIGLTASAAEESYTIEFVSGTGASNGTQVSTKDKIIKNGGDYVSTATAANMFVTDKDYGVRLSSGKNVGSCTLTLSDLGVIIPTRVVVNTAVADANGVLKVNGKTLTYTNTAKPSADPNFEEITVPGISTETELKEIKFEGASGKRVWIKSVTVYYDLPSLVPFTVTFDAGNGNCATESMTESEANAGIVLPEATPNVGCIDWTFAGWSTKSIEQTSENVTLYNAGEVYNPKSDMTLYAVYTAIGEGTVDTLVETLKYDTWTYSGTTTDKSDYRLFGNGSYVESASNVDFSTLTKVIVYGGTFGGSNYNGISIKDADGNIWKDGTVSENKATGVNTFTDGAELNGTAKLRVYSTSGDGSSNGVRISKVEIFCGTPIITNIYNSNPEITATAPEEPTINVEEGQSGDTREFTINVPEGCTVHYRGIAAEEAEANGIESAPAREGEEAPFKQYNGGKLTIAQGETLEMYALHNETGLKSNHVTKSYDEVVTTGVAGIEAENGEVRWFNLQGVEISEPAAGIAIRVQGGKAVKVAK